MEILTNANIIQQLFNYVNVPLCHTENLSYENKFIPFKYTFRLNRRFFFHAFIFLGTNIKDTIFSGAFAPVEPPSATRLILWSILFYKISDFGGES